ncbi:MAG: restriction endonuclease subunit S [Candidatus Hydrogenedentes bacterium]|nr:restriction endonuclease subunit S [Candidatus Hydrogenedentota bacterium]
MSETMKPYPDYKDSGLPWCPRIPSHWELQPNRAFIRQRKALVGDRHSKYTLLSLTKQGVIVRDLTKLKGKHSADMSTFQEVHPGDLVMCLFDVPETPRTVGRSDHYGMITGAYTIFETTDTTAAKWLEAFYMAMDDRKLLSPLYSGLRNTIPRPKFLGTKTPTPTPDEQERIVNFIGLLNRTVNRFIYNRRRLIEVLNEQKQAIINRAVTRGLDPDVSLKPSGIEWLGDIPEHWETRRLRTVADFRVSNVDKHTKEGEVPVRLCNYTDVYKNTVVTADMPFMAATATRDEIEAFRLRIGDVVITKDSEDWQDIGVPALVAETADDLVCGYHLAILRPRPNVAVGRFLSYALQCRGVVAQLNLAAKGVTRYGLSHGAIKAIALPVPPVEKQEPIARHIDEATASLNGAISRATREIDLIREYRTRLIADVVTGKVDVRHLAPPTGSEDLEETIDELEPLDDAAGELEDEALAGEVTHADD